MPCLNQYSGWSLFWGFAGVGLVAYLATGIAGRAMQRNLGDWEHRWSWHPRFLGVTERVLYTVAWLVGKPEFIAWWLALKVAGKWLRWGDGASPADPSGRSGGRHVFNVFLIGNALSLMFGVAGGMVAQGCGALTGILATAAASVLSLAAWYAACGTRVVEPLGQPGRPCALTFWEDVRVLCPRRLLRWLVDRLRRPAP